MTPGWGWVSGVCVPPRLHGSKSRAEGDHTHKEKGKNTCELHLCLRINAFQYHFIQACAYSLFTPEGFPIPGLLETPQVSYSVIIPIHQHKHDKKRAGFPGQLIAGHVDQAKSNGSR